MFCEHCSFSLSPSPSSPGEAGDQNGSFVPVPGAQLQGESGSGNTALHARCGWEGPALSPCGRSYINTTQGACGSSGRVPRAGRRWGSVPPLPSPPGRPGAAGGISPAPNRAWGFSPSNPFSFQPRLFRTSVRDAGCAACRGRFAFLGGFPAEFCEGKTCRGDPGPPRLVLTPGQPPARQQSSPQLLVCVCDCPPTPFFFFLYIKDKWKAKLAEVFKYFILVSNVNSYVVIAVLGVFRLHVTFVIFL